MQRTLYSRSSLPSNKRKGKNVYTAYGELDDTATDFALDDSSLLECEALSLGKRFLRFRRIVVPSSSESSNLSLHNLTVEE
jgi:hypothetical protein